MSKRVSRHVPFLPDDNSSSTMPFLTLSIFIQLLSFFVVLNTHADFSNTKTTVVIESLDKQFSSSFQGSTETPLTVDNNSNKEKTGTSPIDQLQTLLTSASISFELYKINGESLFFIQLSKNDFEKALTQATDGMLIQGKRQKGKMYNRYKNLFTQIATMTSPSKNNLQYEMFVRVHTKTTDNITTNETEALSKYASQLKDLGVPKKYTSFGLTPSSKKVVDLYFIWQGKAKKYKYGVQK